MPWAFLSVLCCAWSPFSGKLSFVLRCRFIILEADAEVTPWSRICVSQADCILLVGAHNSGPKVQSKLSLLLLTFSRRKI